MEMRLHKFTTQGEAVLKEREYDLHLLGTESCSEWEPLVETLEGCEILWRKVAAPEEKSGDGDLAVEFHGVMKHGSCCIGSQRIPGVNLTITDNLVLRDDALLVNDKGVDGTGKIIYGNYLDHPYYMDRIPPPP